MNLPPHSKEFEISVLAGLINDHSVIVKVSALLEPNMFYYTSHRLIYQTILWLHSHGNTIDLLTVQDKLKNTDVDPGELLDISTHVGLNVLSHAKKIKDYWIKRDTIQKAQELINQCLDANTTAKDNKNQYNKLKPFNFSDLDIEKYRNVNLNRIYTFDQMVDSYQDYAINIQNNKVWLYFDTIDKAMHGIRYPEMLTVTSPTGVGKTAMILHVLRNNALHNPMFQNKVIVCFHLELSEIDLVERNLQR
jgi:replicative DNA helicase